MGMRGEEEDDVGPAVSECGNRERCGRPVGRGFGRVRGLDRCGPRRREREMGLGLGTDKKIKGKQ